RRVGRVNWHELRDSLYPDLRGQAASYAGEFRIHRDRIDGCNSDVRTAVHWSPLRSGGPNSLDGGLWRDLHVVDLPGICRIDPSSEPGRVNGNDGVDRSAEGRVFWGAARVDGRRLSERDARYRHGSQLQHWCNGLRRVRAVD